MGQIIINWLIYIIISILMLVLIKCNVTNTYEVYLFTKQQKKSYLIGYLYIAVNVFIFIYFIYIGFLLGSNFMSLFDEVDSFYNIIFNGSEINFLTFYKPIKNLNLSILFILSTICCFKIQSNKKFIEFHKDLPFKNYTGPYVANISLCFIMTLFRLLGWC